MTPKEREILNTILTKSFRQTAAAFFADQQVAAPEVFIKHVEPMAIDVSDCEVVLAETGLMLRRKDIPDRA